MEQDKIGKFIAICRKEHGMTQVQFAEKLGVTNKAVSKWETGKCLPDAALFDDICVLLDITMNEFFAGEKISDEDIAAKADENLIGVVREYQDYSFHTALNAFLFGGRLLKLGKIVSLIAFAITFLCTVDLGINYANAILVDYHDGIVLTGILSRFIYGDRGWSLPVFFESFNNMLMITVILVIENIILWCISIAKGSQT